MTAGDAPDEPAGRASPARVFSAHAEVAVLVVAAAVAAMVLNRRITFVGDSGTYVQGSWSIMRLQGYTWAGDGWIAVFPPLYSALLAALQLVGADFVWAARLVNVASFAVLVGLGTVWTQRISGSRG